MSRIFVQIFMAIGLIFFGLPATARTLGPPERPFQAEFDHVTDLLVKREFPQAEAAVEILLPKYDWGPNRMPSGTGQRYYPGNSFTSDFGQWDKACSKAGNPGEMERIYEAGLKAGNAWGKKQTFEFERICLFAIAKSDELKHPEKVAQFCKTLLSLENAVSETTCMDLIQLANKINHGPSAVSAAAIYKLVGSTPEFAVELVGNHGAQLRLPGSAVRHDSAPQMINSGMAVISRSIKDPRVKQYLSVYAKQAISQKSYDGIAVMFTSWVTKVNAEKMRGRKTFVTNFAANSDVEILSDLVTQVGFGSNPKAAIPICKLQIEIAEKSHESDVQMAKMYSIYRSILKSCRLTTEEAAAAAQLEKYSRSAK